MTYEKTGFGIGEVSLETITKIREAASQISRLLDGLRPDQKLPGPETACQIIADRLADVGGQSTEDWFTLSALLSHPSSKVARRLVDGLDTLAVALADYDDPVVSTTQTRLRKLHLPHVLAHYVEATSAPVPSTPPLSRWAYVLEAAGDGSFVVIGTTHGSMERVLSSAANSNPGIGPFGVSAAWRITDPIRSASLLSASFESSHLGNGFYACRDDADFKSIKARAEEELEGAKLVIGNPGWRSSVFSSLADGNLAEIAVESPAFRSDASEVFAAFRR